ncbi:hypothetical protein [Geminicoccus harenae]|uniref:hypothetical protein n=1 Tax=Geminicoccus harenae TaxID=2498453 RepID=UPI00168A79AF|nr:hypothetical protein [Geminicoccus harenae]
MTEEDLLASCWAVRAFDTLRAMAAARRDQRHLATLNEIVTRWKQRKPGRNDRAVINRQIRMTARYCDMIEAEEEAQLDQLLDRVLDRGADPKARLTYASKEVAVAIVDAQEQKREQAKRRAEIIASARTVGAGNRANLATLATILNLTDHKLLAPGPTAVTVAEDGRFVELVSDALAEISGRQPHPPTVRSAINRALQKRKNAQPKP